MRWLNFFLFFIIITVSDIFTLEIKTSKSTLKLPELNTLDSENSFRQADRIAEIALSELNADAAALDQEEENLSKEITDYEQKKKGEQESLDKLVFRYNEMEKKYLENLGQYDKKREAHDEEAADQNAQVEESNNLPPENRDQQTVDRLNEWAKEINERKELLDKERDILLKEHEALEIQRKAAISFEEGAVARLKVVYDPLDTKIKAFNVRQGQVYRQLKQCSEYAQEIKKMVKEKNYNWESFVFTKALDTALEKIKALSGRGFDSP